eukprot:m.249085 g.249085  ORF g.249085 m.249085 type:complete len:220 (-) comp19083_c0_seq4:35-694(-)
MSTSHQRNYIFPPNAPPSHTKDFGTTSSGTKAAKRCVKLSNTTSASCILGKLSFLPASSLPRTPNKTAPPPHCTWLNYPRMLFPPFTPSLSFNRITTRGMVALCDLIAIHPTLTEIHVSNNKIGDEGALLLCTALQRNTRVTELWIKGCSVTDEGLDALTDALADCPDLSNFLIESNDFSSAAVANCALTLPKARISTSLPSKDVEAAKKMLLEALPPK